MALLSLKSRNSNQLNSFASIRHWIDKFHKYILSLSMVVSTYLDQANLSKFH